MMGFCKSERVEKVVEYVVPQFGLVHVGSMPCSWYHGDHVVW